MAKKHKKAGKTPNTKPSEGGVLLSSNAGSTSNAPSDTSQSTTQATSSSSKLVQEMSNLTLATPGGSNANSQANVPKPKQAQSKQKNAQKPANQEPSKSNEPSIVEGGASKKSKKKKKQNTQNAQQNKKNVSANKVIGKPPPKAPKLIAPDPPAPKKELKVTKFTHAPLETRLKFTILFKHETAFYAPDILETPLVAHGFKKSRNYKDQGLEISRCIDQFVVKDKLNEIVTTITSVLENNKRILINDDMLFYALAKCLHVVRQDPKAKLPSITILEFRTKILALAMKETSSGKHLLQFVFYLLNFSLKMLENTAIRHAINKWYLLKPAEDLLRQCALGSRFKGLSHGDVLRLIHFNVGAMFPDPQLALLAIMHGFSVISARLVSGSFPDNVKPAFLKKYDCYDKADDKIKALIKDMAVIKSPKGHQKPLAEIVKARKLSIHDVHAQFHRSYKVNSAAIENSTQRELLQNMRHYRINNILSSAAPAQVDGVTTADTYLKRLGVTPDADIHPAQVMAAYVEYVLAPQKCFDQHGQKETPKDAEQTEAKPPATSQPEESPKPGGKPLTSIRPPEASIVKALEELYTKSFQNLKKVSAKIVVCIDLQDTLVQSPCRNYPALQGSHESMLVLQCLFHMVDNLDNLKVMGFRNRGIFNRPVVRLKKHLKKIEAVETKSEEDPAGLEELTDVGGSEDETEVKEEKEEKKNETIIDTLEATWKHYRKQLRGTRGICVHKLFTVAETWNQFIPDVFVVITSQASLSLYMADVVFSAYMKNTKKPHAKLIVISPSSHLPSCRNIHRKNMLHIVGWDDKITHLIEDFLANKIF